MSEQEITEFVDSMPSLSPRHDATLARLLEERRRLLESLRNILEHESERFWGEDRKTLAFAEASVLEKSDV